MSRRDDDPGAEQPLLRRASSRAGGAYDGSDAHAADDAAPATPPAHVLGPLLRERLLLVVAWAVAAGAALAVLCTISIRAARAAAVAVLADKVKPSDLPVQNVVFGGAFVAFAALPTGYARSMAGSAVGAKARIVQAAAAPWAAAFLLQGLRALLLSARALQAGDGAQGRPGSALRGSPIVVAATWAVAAAAAAAAAAAMMTVLARIDAGQGNVGVFVSAPRPGARRTGCCGVLCTPHDHFLFLGGGAGGRGADHGGGSGGDARAAPAGQLFAVRTPQAFMFFWASIIAYLSTIILLWTAAADVATAVSFAAGWKPDSPAATAAAGTAFAVALGVGCGATSGMVRCVMAAWMATDCFDLLLFARRTGHADLAWGAAAGLAVCVAAIVSGWPSAQSSVRGAAHAAAAAAQARRVGGGAGGQAPPPPPLPGVDGSDVLSESFCPPWPRGCDQSAAGAPRGVALV